MLKEFEKCFSNCSLLGCFLYHSSYVNVLAYCDTLSRTFTIIVDQSLKLLCLYTKSLAFARSLSNVEKSTSLRLILLFQRSSGVFLLTLYVILSGMVIFGREALGVVDESIACFVTTELSFSWFVFVVCSDSIILDPVLHIKELVVFCFICNGHDNNNQIVSRILGLEKPRVLSLLLLTDLENSLFSIAN
jgi:hypothetical protein